MRSRRHHGSSNMPRSGATECASIEEEPVNLRQAVPSKWACRAALLALLAAPAPAAWGDDQRPTLNVYAMPVPPFVMGEVGKLDGFCVEVWEEVAGRLKVASKYTLAPDVVAVDKALRAGEVDVCITPVPYSAERDREFDFTYAILNSGLQVMVPGPGAAIEDRPLLAFLGVFFSRSMAYWLFAALVLILVPAHVIWFLDRRSEDGIGQGAPYLPGIYHALVWTSEALVSQAQSMPRARAARFLGTLWLFMGVVFVAYFTAQLTSDLTVQQMRGVIQGPQDLPGKEVGVLVDTPAADYVRGIGARPRSYSQPEAAYEALQRGEVDAVVLGAPALRYHATHAGKGKVQLVGPEFRKADYGFLVPLNSPQRKRISNALLAMREDGTFQRIYEKWFGGE